MTLPIWVFDFETFYSAEYTLKKLTTEQYCRDPRFAALLLGVRDPKGSLAWYGQEDIPAFLASVDWSQAALLAHHAQFDGLILAHHYGIKPRLWLDTLSMARQVLGTHVSASLGSLSQHYGLEPKSVPYNLFIGKRWADLDHPTRRLLGEGCLHDVELTHDIFQRLVASGFPSEEYQVVSMTVEMFTQPLLRGDTELLRDLWRREAARKGDLLAELNVTSEDLQSAEKFAALLRAEGVEPEKKDGKNGDIYAFAKTDDFMKDQLESDDDRVALLCQARLGLKSTIDQTRAERLGGMSARGAMPVYLRYCGAHTTRWSGGDGLNWQNFRRGGDLRRAITAPAGCSLVVLDLSQIEARILAVVAGQWDLVEKFRNGEDPYIGIASEFYQKPVTKADPAERGTGKQLVLSCLGPDTLVLTDSGPKPITAVTMDDWLWDGTKWGMHGGIVERGKKDAIQVAGFWLTPDHQVFCVNRWVQAQSLQNESILSQALETGSESLWSLATKLGQGAGLSQFWLDVLVNRPSTPSIRITYFLAKARAAIRAQRKRLDTGLKNITAMLTSFLMTRIGAAFLDGSPTSSGAAPTQNTKTGRPMGDAELGAFGKKTNVRFYNTWSDFQEPLTRLLIWIAETIQKATNRETFDSSREEKTAKIAEPSLPLKRNLPTYDIMYAGSKNCFTIMTATGQALLVHNCGYGSGADTIKATAKKGTYGPPVLLSDSQAEDAKNLYRSRNPAIVAYWGVAGRMLARIGGGEPLQWGPMLIKDKRVYLPNGGWLGYETLEYDQEWQNWKYRTRKGWSRIWGSKLVAETTQALARVVASQAMLRMRGVGIKIAWCTHDDIVAVAPTNRAQEVYDFMLREMKRPPAWLPELPLDAEGFIGDRYSK